MSQISFFDNTLAVPETYEDIDRLLDIVREDDTDDDLFTNADIKNGKSYFFYGTKVFEFSQRTNETKKSKLKVSPDILTAMGHDTVKSNQSAFCLVTLKNSGDVDAFITALKAKKHSLFRNLITDTFGCCNSFMECSEAGECIHQKERFYNGCTYRTNLEQGKIFYGPKRNID